MLKVLLIAGGAAIALPLVVLLVLGLYLVSGGVAMVEVDSPDLQLQLPVPLRLADLGLGVAALAVPDVEREAWRGELERELGSAFRSSRQRPGLESDLSIEELGDTIEELLEAVDRCPDGVLLIVESGAESVRVEKRRGRLTVEVDGVEERVRVSAPTRAVARLGARLADLVEG